METQKYVVIAFALVLFITGTAISEESQISDTREASCALQIITYTDIMPLNIVAIINSSGVTGKAIQEVLDSAPPELVEISIDSINVVRSETKTTIICELKVHLNAADVKPAANEFLKALIDNLRESLNQIYTEYFQENIKQLNYAQEQYDEAESHLNEATEYIPRISVIPIDTDISAVQRAVQAQLEQEVNFSNITPETTFGEIIDRLRNSVDPPLQIQTNWSDLYDMAHIDRDTPCQMDPLTGIKLSKVLDVLLEALSIDPVELDYIVDEGVITIATKDTLPNKMVTFLYDISGFLINGRTSSSFIYAIEETIEPESWYDISEEGEGNIVDMLGGKISVYNTPEIQEKLTNFLANFPIDSSIEPSANIPVEMLIDEKQDLIQHKRLLEMEVARLEARQTTAEQQIMSVSSKIKSAFTATLLNYELEIYTKELEEKKKTLTSQHPEVQIAQEQIDSVKAKIASIEEDTVTAELEQLIETQTQQLEIIKKQHDTLVASGHAFAGPSKEIIEAEEKLARLKIELARRREELARPAGVGSLGTLNENLSMTILDLAEKKAELQVVEKLLSEIEGQIRAASTTDPNILKIRQAKQALERAQKRLNELKIIEENLQPPKIIVIGAD